MTPKQLNIYQLIVCTGLYAYLYTSYGWRVLVAVFLVQWWMNIELSVRGMERK
jgi:hypothetical protein